MTADAGGEMENAAATIRAFDIIVGPLLASLDGVMDDVAAARDRYQWVPADGSRAMAELASEDRFGGPWRTQPVAEAHQHAGFLLLAAQDHAAGMCRLLRQPETSVFAHVPMARSALEACALAQRLGDHRIDVDTRVARYMTESLYSDDQMAKFSAEVRAGRKVKRDQILAQAAAAGLGKAPSQRNRPAAIVEARPTMTALMTDLFKDGVGEDLDLGRLLYVLYSAVAHGTAFGLRESLRPLDEHDVRAEGWAPQQGHLIAGVGVDADAVAFVVGAVTHGYLKAAGSVMALMGWESEERQRHAANALHLVQRAFDQAEARKQHQL